MGRNNNNNNVLASVNNSINNLNKNVKKVVSNDILVNSIRVLIIIYAAFVIPQLSVENLKFINNNIVRLVVISLIVYLSFLDMVTALLLLVSFILTIHHSSAPRQVNNNNVVANNQGIVNAVNNLTRGEVENFNEQVKNNVEVNEALNNVFNKNTDVEAANAEESQNKGVNLNENLNNNGLVNTVDDSREILNGQVNSVPDAFDAEKNTNSVVDQVNNAEKKNNNNNNLSVNDSIVIENNNQPASETMTESILRAKGSKNDPNAPVGLTTAQHLYDISENAVPGADINDQMLTFQNQHGIQGMDQVTGPNRARHEGYHYNNEAERPNLTSEMILDRRSP